MIKRFWCWLNGIKAPELPTPEIKRVEARVKALEVRVSVLERRA